MIDDNTLELMHLVIDGSASAAQREALQPRLQSDPEARARFDSLQRVMRCIESVPDATPTPCWQPTYSATSASRALTFGPSTK